MGRKFCWECRRPKCVCLCATFFDFSTKASITILAHAREARRGTSSGLLAHRSLPNSKYLVDFCFENSAKFLSVIEDPEVESYLLYPRDNAAPVSTIIQSLEGTHNLSHSMKGHSNVNLIVIEGTWAQARTMLNHSPKLQSLPAVTLDRPRQSRFQIRSQPRPKYLSTIEAIAYALNDLGEFSDHRTELFLNPFLSMVDQHVEYQKRNQPRFRQSSKPDKALV